MISLYGYIVGMHYIDLERHAFDYQARLVKELDHDRQVDLALAAARSAAVAAADARWSASLARGVHARPARRGPAWHERLLAALQHSVTAATRAAHHARNAVLSH
jgi:hypothetical protein